MKLKWDKERQWLSSVRQCSDEEESDNKAACRPCNQKLAYNHLTGAMRNHIQLRHLEINRQGEQVPTSNTLQRSITTFATPTYRRCDADRSENIM